MVFGVISLMIWWLLGVLVLSMFVEWCRGGLFPLLFYELFRKNGIAGTLMLQCHP